MRVAVVFLLLAVAAQGNAQGRRTKPPAKAPGKAVGVRQNEEFVDPDVLSQVFTSTPPPTDERYVPNNNAEDSKEPLSQEFICSVFGGPSCPEDSPPADVPCLCDSTEDCKCVPYYQCDKSTGSFNEFGVGVIDIRQGNSSCPHYIYKCCKLSDTKIPPHSKQPPEPSPPYNPEPSPPYNPEPSPPYNPEPPPYKPEPSPPYNPEPPPPYKPEPSPPYNPEPPPPYNPEPPPYKPEPSPPYNPEPNPEQPYNPSPQEQYPTSYPPQQPQQPPQPPSSGPARCGVRNPEGVGVRITGDEDGEAQFGEFPWMVAILRVETSDVDDKKRNLYQCGGALITPQVVLTAAHCVKKSGTTAHQIKVRAGEWDTQTSKEIFRHQDVTVEDIIIHPDYYAGAVHNDVALLLLDDPVHVGYHIGTICMPEQNQNFDYNKCFVSGWGKDKFGQQGRYQVILKKLELPIVPHDECQEQLRRTRLGSYFNLHHSFICAGGQEGKDTCKGDGGSPLVCPMPHDPTRYQLAGTVAWGIDCGLANVPGVYGNVPLFREWVDEQLRLHNIDNAPYLS